jgi:hypothetical protein
MNKELPQGILKAPKIYPLQWFTRESIPRDIRLEPWAVAAERGSLDDLGILSGSLGELAKN